jgi:hypothetical protein
LPKIFIFLPENIFPICQEKEHHQLTLVAMAVAVAVAVAVPPLSVTMSGTQHGSGQLFHSCETGAHNVQRESKRCKTEVFVNRCQKRGQGTGFCFLFSELQLFYYYLLRLGWSLIRYIKRYKFLRKKKRSIKRYRW